jgi:hypothetical protein
MCQPSNIKNIFAFIAIFILFSTFSWSENSFSGAEIQTLTSRVSSATDNAEERADGSMYLTSSDLELISDNGNRQTVGIRFPNLSIPENATVTKAYIQFKVDETSSESTQLTIYGENMDNASAFANTMHNISAMPN